MPRIRTVKPEIHQDEAVGELSDSAFRLFIGLITLADDYGRLRAGLGLLNSQVWPYRPKPLEEVDHLLAELASAELVERYEVEGKPFVCLPNWAHHQRIDNAGKSRIPGPDQATRGSSPRVSASDGASPLDQGREGKGPRKGRGGESAADAASPLTAVLAKLEEVAFVHGKPAPDPDAARTFCEEFAKRDLLALAAKFAHYRTGPGAKRPLPSHDVLWAFRVWVEGEREDPTPPAAERPKKDYSKYDAVVEPAA